MRDIEARATDFGVTVTDFKTPLSKEVRSTSGIVNGRPGVGHAFYDRAVITRRAKRSFSGRPVSRADKFAGVPSAAPGAEAF